MLGPTRQFAPAKISPTDSTAAARTFQLASPMSLTNLSVMRPEMSARGRLPPPPPPTPPEVAALAPTVARTVLAGFDPGS